MTPGNTEFRPIHNPYIVGNPIRDRKMFYGREDDFAYVQQKVSGGQRGGLLVLCGTRRSGKTSILFQIMNGRLGESFVPVLIDMQAMTVENDLDFLMRLAEGMIEALGDPELALDRDFLSRRGEGTLSAFQHFIARATQRLDGRKFILLFDEYEILESHISKKLISIDVLNLLANWIEHHEGVFMVFTGSDRLEERTAEYWEHFLGKALHRRISFLSRGDTLRLVTEPVAGEVHYEPGIPEDLYALTAGQPFYTQVYCQAIVDHLNEEGRRDVDADDLESVTNQIIENPLPQMVFAWNSLRALEKMTLSIIGEVSKAGVRPVSAGDIAAFAKQEKIRYRLDPAKLNETLEQLFHHDMLGKEGDEAAYTFRMDLWRRWVARMHSIWQVVDEVRQAPPEEMEGITPDRPGRRVWPVVAAAAVVVAGSWLVYANRPRPAAMVAPDSAWVTVRTSPADADVFLDDQRLARPVENRRVVAGAGQLRVERLGYLDFVEDIQLQKDDSLQREIVLTEKQGGLEVTSSPDGATVYLDGKDVGMTPATIPNLSVNRTYEVRLTLANYVARDFAGVQVVADSTVMLHHDFSRAAASIQFVTTPGGADVSVDGKRVGVSPNVFSLTYGPHDVSIEKPGYTPVRRNIRVPDVGERVSVALERVPTGVLVVQVVPYADIYVNGERKKSQTSHCRLELDPGEYEVRLEHPTYGAVTRMETVRSNEETVLAYDWTSSRP